MNLGRLQRVYDVLGPVGSMACVLLASAVIFLVLVVKPLEARNEQLEQRLTGSVRRGSPSPNLDSENHNTARKLAAFYRFVESKESTADKLVTLYTAGAAAGVELRSAEYRLQRTDARIERYEITLPISGNYVQIRTFLENTLVQIPALSLDQLSFRRQHANDAMVQAEVRLTLHRMAP